MKNVTIKKKLYLLAFIVGSIFISLNMVLFYNAFTVKDTWTEYNNTIKQKMILLSNIKSTFGYGGSVHNFKNYIIRGDEKYLSLFEKNYLNFTININKYLNIDNLSDLEKESLHEISKTFQTYKENLLKAVELKQKGFTILQIDKQIKVDDRKSIVAMQNIEIYFENASENTTKNVYDKIYITYNLSFMIIMLLLFLIAYLGFFFDSTIIKPLRKFEQGLSNFFKFLNKEIPEIEPIDLHNKDEFGIMAQITNSNILVASKMHKNMYQTNEELSQLIDSFSENVIASRTNLEGEITYITNAFEEISGFSKDELLGQSHNIVRHPDMKSETFKKMWEILQNGNIWSGEVKNLKKDGGYYWVKAVISPIKDNTGKIEGYSSIRENITSRKKVEELNQELNDYKYHLEDKVQEATKEIIYLNKEIEDTQKEVVFTMGSIGESRSKETGNHVRRVAEYSKLLALYYGLDPKDAELLKQASPMHDIGKVGIPDSILNKPSKLTVEEFGEMKSHCSIGFDMLKNSTRPLLQTAAIVASQHHEKWNGKGYPNGLSGDNIHIYGRITAVADVFDALGSHRVYKKAWNDEQILNLFKEERGEHFDPKLVDIFFEHLDEFITIRDNSKDII